MSINAKEFILSRVNPARTTGPAAPDNTLAGDWETLCGGEATTADLQNLHNERRRMTDCQDRTSDVVTERRFTGRTVSVSLSGTVENSAAGRWLLATANSSDPTIADGRLYLPGVAYWRSDWKITSFQIAAADLDGNTTFSATLESSGAITYTEIALP